MTPMAARGVLEAVYWKPAFRWHIARVHVLNPIEFEPVYAGRMDQNESDRRRAAIVLTNVAYVIEASIGLTDKAGPDDNLPRHYRGFRRRAARGEAFQLPSLGMPEFPASFALIDDEAPLPPSALGGSIDLGWMLHDVDYERGQVQRFFRARVENGVIDVPPYGDPDLAA